MTEISRGVKADLARAYASTKRAGVQASRLLEATPELGLLIQHLDHSIEFLEKALKELLPKEEWLELSDTVDQRVRVQAGVPRKILPSGAPEERRIQKRILVAFEAYWVRAHSAAGQFARLGDLSLGGCFVRTVTNPQIGESVSIEIRLSNGQWITVEGRVVNHRAREGFGVSFASLPDPAQSFLRELINSSSSG